MFKQWLSLQEGQMYFDFMKVPSVTWEQKEKMKLFGPVWHGTTKENRSKIADTGFKVFIGGSRSGNVSNGYLSQNYHGGIPAPIHNQGFGIYFTNSETIAKKFNGGTKEGLIAYYINAPRLEIINFGANSTMMKWWKTHGFDMPPVTDFNSSETEQMRIDATQNLTNVLKSKYDAVWFKGKGMRGGLLDGDQICVFDPNNIYKLRLPTDEERRGEWQFIPGDRVLIKGTKATAEIKGIRKNGGSDELANVIGRSPSLLTVKIKDPKDEIKALYGKTVAEGILKNHPDWIQNRMNNGNFPSIEAAVEDYVNHYFGSSLALNFPSNLVDRVLAKGERIK